MISHSVDDFQHHKRFLESKLIEIPFLYSGDVIKSHHITEHSVGDTDSYQEKLVNLQVENIYNWSFMQMQIKSTEIKIEKTEHITIDDIISKIPHHCNFMFFSNNFIFEFLEPHSGHLQFEIDGVFEQFSKTFRLNLLGREISAFQSPLIEDSLKQLVVYFTDKPIQSFVWTSQNMNYDICFNQSGYKHTVSYPVYQCDYLAYRVVISDTQYLRQEKINQILS
jgi:hypothetical protein